MTKSIKDLNIETKEFIKKNNIFVDEGDSYDVWLSKGPNNISSFGKPNSVANIKKVKHESSLTYAGEIMYEATYTFDDLGRRNTRHIDSEKTKKAIFFGDSILFGEGLNDNKTFPYYFEYFNQEYESYNYGFPGHGPGQMLLHIQSDEFFKEFNNSEGDVFFLFRDDAIKNSVGKVSWNEGYPKFEIQNEEIVQVGFFNNEPGEESYLPSEFTNDDYNITVKIFEKCKNELKKISDKLNFSVIIVPLSFSNFKIHSMLTEKNINVFNLFHVDTESYLGDATRFLDGAPTKFTNKFLNQRMYYYKISNIDTTPIIPFNEFLQYDELLRRIKTHSFLMSPMNDFPEDDAGVVISMILRQYKGNQKIDEFNLMELSKDYFYKKKKALYYLDNNKDLELRELFKDLEPYLFDMFKKEYIDFKKMFNPNEYIIDE